MKNLKYAMIAAVGALGVTSAGGAFTQTASQKTQPTPQMDRQMMGNGTSMGGGMMGMMQNPEMHQQMMQMMQNCNKMMEQKMASGASAPRT